MRITDDVVQVMRDTYHNAAKDVTRSHFDCLRIGLEAVAETLVSDGYHTRVVESWQVASGVTVCPRDWIGKHVIVTLDPDYAEMDAAPSPTNEGE